MNEDSPIGALLASDPTREWGALLGLIAAGSALIHIGYGDLIPLAWLAWNLR